MKAELNRACLEKWNWQSADLCALMRLVILMQAKQNCSVTVLKGLKPRPYFSVFCLRARSTIKSCCWRHIGAPLRFLFSVSSPSLCSNSDESSLLVQYHQDGLIKFISCDLFVKVNKKNFFLSHNNFCCLNRLGFVKTICPYWKKMIFVTPFYHKQPVCAAEINHLSIVLFVWAYGHFLFCSFCGAMKFFLSI